MQTFTRALLATLLLLAPLQATAGASSWDTTAASNNSAPPDGAPEGMASSGVNDVMRQIMADARAGYGLVAETEAALKAWTVKGGYAIVIGNSAALDQSPRVYKWDASDTTADDGEIYLIPDDITHPAAGRWIKVDGNVVVGNAGPHSFGGTSSDSRFTVEGSFTSPAAGNAAYAFLNDGALTGAATDTTRLTGFMGDVAITTQTATESITNISQMQLNEPSITDNLTGSITNASTLLITGAPTEGTNNYAFFVDTGTTRLDGDVDLTNTTTTQLMLPISNDAVSPTLAFGDGDSGFYEASDDVIDIGIAGAQAFSISATSFFGSQVDGPSVLDESCSVTNPCFTRTDDNDTGVGFDGSNAGSLVSAGVSVFSWNAGGPQVEKTLGLSVSTLTVATGAVAVTQSYHLIAGESGANDTLDTISGGTTGEILIIGASSNSVDIIIGDLTGNIDISAALTLDHVNDTLTLLFNGTVWVETGRGANST